MKSVTRNTMKGFCSTTALWCKFLFDLLNKSRNFLYLRGGVPTRQFDIRKLDKSLKWRHFLIWYPFLYNSRVTFAFILNKIKIYTTLVVYVHCLIKYYMFIWFQNRFLNILSSVAYFNHNKTNILIISWKLDAYLIVCYNKIFNNTFFIKTKKIILNYYKGKKTSLLWNSFQIGIPIGCRLGKFYQSFINNFRDICVTLSQ